MSVRFLRRKRCTKKSERYQKNSKEKQIKVGGGGRSATTGFQFYFVVNAKKASKIKSQGAVATSVNLAAVTQFV
jgi:hypothetical protein